MPLSRTTEAVTDGVLKQVTGVSAEIAPQARLREDLGIDSLSLVMVLFELGSQLEIDVANSRIELSLLLTKEDLVRAIDELRGPRAVQ